MSMTPQLSLGSWEAIGALAAPVRTAVFVHEQGIPAELEWDDADAVSLHCVARLGDTIAGTGRLLPDGHIGRMAVLPDYRGHGLGGVILERLVVAARERGDEAVELSAQVAVLDFYRRHGFVALGEVYQEVGIPHQRMRRVLDSVDPDSPVPSGMRAHAAGTSAEPYAAGTGAEPYAAVTAELGEVTSGAAGMRLRTRLWRPSMPHGGGLYLLHGLGEHAGRYEALARWLCARGWTVASHDHLGHGESGGRRGVLDLDERLSRDAADRIASFARELGRPPILLGHSMGGAVAADLVATRGLTVAGLVLSSPALAVRVGAPMRLLASLLARLAPDLALGNGLDAHRLSSDPAAVSAYRRDPLVHDRISPRLFAWILRAGSQARAAAGTVTVPVLLLVAGDDAMVDPEGSHAFARALPDPLASFHLFDGLQHEIFNERPEARDRVLGELAGWLAQRMPGTAGAP